MGDRQIGTYQDIANWLVIQPSEYVTAGMLGIVGRQSVAGTTAVNLDAIDLNSVKNQYESSGKVTVKYMHIAYNKQANGTVTDFYFGVLFGIVHPVNVGDLYPYLDANLKQAMTDLQMFARSDFIVYMLGLTQSANTYSWIWEAFSSEYLIYASPPPTEAALRATLLANGKIGDAINAFKAKAAEGGITVTVRGYNIDLLRAEYLRTVSGGSQGVDKDVYHTHLTLRVDFDTDKPITQSPILPLMVLAIAVGIALIVGAIGLVVYFNNLSTSKSEVKTLVTNPNDTPVDVTIGGKTYTIPAHGTLETSETIEGGGTSIIAQLPLIIVGTVLLLAAAIVGSRFIGKKGD
jgi:hypothetical protein